MTRLVTQWRAGHEPQARFARRHGVHPWTFWYWRRKVEGASSSPRAARPIFVPVQVVPDTARGAAATIEVILVSGERLTIPAGASSDQLRTVLAALRTGC